MPLSSALRNMASAGRGRYADEVVDHSTTGRHELAIRFRELQRDPIRRRDELLLAGVDYARALVDDDPLLALEVSDWTLGLVRAPAAPEDAECAVRLAGVALNAAVEVADPATLSALVDRCLSLVPDPSAYGIDPVDWILMAAEADRQGGRLELCCERLEEALEHGGGPGRSGRMLAIMTSAVHALAAAVTPCPFIGLIESALSDARRPPSDRRLVNVILAVLAQARLVDSDVASAELFTRQIETDARHLTPVVGLVAARVALAGGDARRAVEWLDRPVASGASDEATELGRLHVHAEASVELDEPEARVLVADLIRRAGSSRGPEAHALLARAKVLLAELQHRMGDGSAAYRTLRSVQNEASGRTTEPQAEVDLRDGATAVTVRSIAALGSDGGSLVALVDAPGRYSTAGRLAMLLDALRSSPHLDSSRVFVEVLDIPSARWVEDVLDVLAAAQVPAERIVLHLGREVLREVAGSRLAALAGIRARGAWLSVEAVPEALSAAILDDASNVDVCVARLAGPDDSSTAVADAVRSCLVGLGVQLIVDGVDDADDVAAARRLGADAVGGRAVSPVLTVTQLARQRSSAAPSL